MHISSNKRAHATSGILLCVTFAQRHLIWWHENYHGKNANVLLLYHPFPDKLDATCKWICCVSIHFRIHAEGGFSYTCDFFMNTIRHIYLINRVSGEKKMSREKQHWFDCRTQTKSNVWLVMSRRNSDGNKWMSFRIPKRTTIASIRTPITYVNRNRCRNPYENTDLSHCELVSAVLSCRSQEKCFAGNGFILRLSINVNSWEWIHVC